MNRRDFLKTLLGGVATAAVAAPALTQTWTGVDLGSGQDFTVEMWIKKTKDGHTWVDEFRVSEGIARYSENFGVPKAIGTRVGDVIAKELSEEAKHQGWHHFAVSGQCGVERLYIDGELQETRPSPGYVMARAFEPIREGDAVCWFDEADTITEEMLAALDKFDTPSQRQFHGYLDDGRFATLTLLDK